MSRCLNRVSGPGSGTIRFSPCQLTQEMRPSSYAIDFSLTRLSRLLSPTLDEPNQLDILDRVVVRANRPNVGEVRFPARHISTLHVFIETLERDTIVWRVNRPLLLVHWPKERTLRLGF